jgi:hypothetical protein
MTKLKENRDDLCSPCWIPLETICSPGEGAVLQQHLHAARRPAARGRGAGAGGAASAGGARAGRFLFRRKIECWAGVAMDFGSLLFADQYANEKSRGPICMLGWSCSYHNYIWINAENGIYDKRLVSTNTPFQFRIYFNILSSKAKVHHKNISTCTCLWSLLNF